MEREIYTFHTPIHTEKVVLEKFANILMFYERTYMVKERRLYLQKQSFRVDWLYLMDSKPPRRMVEVVLTAFQSLGSVLMHYLVLKVMLPEFLMVLRRT